MIILSISCADSMLAASATGQSRGNLGAECGLARPRVNFASEPYSRPQHIREPGVLADVAAPLMPIEIGQRQELLETGNATARLENILALMNNGRRAA
jgi:ATP-dependent Lon protease